MFAWCGVKVRDGRILMVWSPQPPRLIPRCFRPWRILSLVSAFLTSIAQRVPRPRERERTSGNLDSSSARPLRMVLPVLLTRSSKLSSRIILTTCKRKLISSSLDACVTSDLLKHNDLVWVPDPGVEDPARVRGPVLQVVVHAPWQHLLGEGHHVGLQPEVLVGPHLARASGPGLDLVHHQGYVVLLTNVLQSLEKVGAAVIVAALRLDWLRDDARHGLAVQSLE